MTFTHKFYYGVLGANIGFFVLTGNVVNLVVIVAMLFLQPKKVTNE